MAKGYRLLIILSIVLLSLSAVIAQTEEENAEFNTLYQPLKVVQKLSYDNFKRIKLMYTSIMNFGGGDQEFDKLVNDYAEATGFYFQKNMIESANRFTKNEKDITDIAMRIAKKYKEDTEVLYNELIKKNIRFNIKRDIEKKEMNPYNDKTLSGASFALEKANDFYLMTRPVEAIAHFRKAKESCFQLYEILGEKVPEQYKKDIVDNRNQVYESKEKKI